VPGRRDADQVEAEIGCPAFDSLGEGHRLPETSEVFNKTSEVLDVD